MKLYDFNDTPAIKQLFDDLESLETGELPDDFIQSRMDGHPDDTQEIEKKIESLAKLHRSIAADIVAKTAERDHFNERVRIDKNKLASLSRYIEILMRGSNIQKVQGDLLTVSLRKAPVSCVVLQEADIPPEWVEELVSRTLKKAEMIRHFKATHEEISGVMFVEDRTTLSIR